MNRIEFSTQTHKAVLCPISGQLNATSVKEDYEDIVINIFNPPEMLMSESEPLRLLLDLGKHFAEKWKEQNRNLSVRITINSETPYEDSEKIKAAQNILGKCMLVSSDFKHIENDIHYVPVIPLAEKTDVICSVKTICDAYGITALDFQS